MAEAPKTPKEYLDNLPEDRRKAMRQVRAAVNRGMPKGYQETIQYGMIGWSVPHRLYPDGYHCDPKQPVPFASIASQKNHMAIYLMCTYIDEAERAWLEQEWAKTGKKLDMGKSCIRFKRVEDLPLELITEAVSRVPVEKFLARYRELIPAGKRKKRQGSKAVTQ
jgi:uncharacterized protein YdhG (YjbR/CyaY superfamily)